MTGAPDSSLELGELPFLRSPFSFAFVFPRTRGSWFLFPWEGGHRLPLSPGLSPAKLLLSDLLAHSYQAAHSL